MVPAGSRTGPAVRGPIRSRAVLGEPGPSRSPAGPAKPGPSRNRAVPVGPGQHRNPVRPGLAGRGLIRDPARPGFGEPGRSRGLGTPGPAGPGRSRGRVRPGWSRRNRAGRAGAGRERQHPAGCRTPVDCRTGRPVDDCRKSVDPGECCAHPVDNHPVGGLRSVDKPVDTRCFAGPKPVDNRCGPAKPTPARSTPTRPAGRTANPRHLRVRPRSVNLASPKRPSSDARNQPGETS